MLQTQLQEYCLKFMVMGSCFYHQNRDQEFSKRIPFPRYGLCHLTLLQIKHIREETNTYLFWGGVCVGVCGHGVGMGVCAE